MTRERVLLPAALVAQQFAVYGYDVTVASRDGCPGADSIAVDRAVVSDFGRDRSDRLRRRGGCRPDVRACERNP